MEQFARKCVEYTAEQKVSTSPNNSYGHLQTPAWLHAFGAVQLEFSRQQITKTGIVEAAYWFLAT